MNLINFEDLRTTPWKNGGGVTREIACFPQHASFDDFAWRISIADVSQSGPFSVLPGIDRIIALLDGDGMQLRFDDGRQHALSTPLVPFRFRGEDRVQAELMGAASRDFNLMLRRDMVDGSLAVFREVATLECEPGFLALFCAAGRWEVAGADDQRHQLARHSTLTCATTSVAITPLEAASVLITARVIYRS